MKMPRTTGPLVFFIFLMICLMTIHLQPTTGQKRDLPQLFLINDSTAFIDSSGQVVISASQPSLIEDVTRASPKMRGFRDDVEQPWIRFGDFSEGLAVIGWALCPMCRNNFWVNGVINESGRLVIPPFGSSTRFGDFHEGLARYSDHGWGFIDRHGLVVIPAKFYEAGDFSEGLSVVRSSDTSRFGYINQKGELVIPYTFVRASNFHEGLAAVAISKGQYGYIDKTGTVMLRGTDWFEVQDFSEGLAAVQVEVLDNSVYRGYKERRYGFIDRAGKFVIPAQFGMAKKFSEGRALITLPDRADVGFIDASGKVVIKPQFVNGQSFSEGLAAVAVETADKKTLWGYINPGGEWIITPQFQNAGPFRGGLAAVDCDHYGARCQAYIDKTGTARWRKT